VSINEPAPADNPLTETYTAPFEAPPPPSVLGPATIGPPDNPPWGIPAAVAVWFISVALLFFVPLIAVIPYIVYKQMALGAVEGFAKDPNLIFISILGVLPAHILTVLVVWFVATNKGRRPFWPALGWTWTKNFRPLKTIGLAVLLLVVGSAITWLIGGSETQLDQIINSSLKTRFVTAFLAAATGPLVEELVYRGILYSAFQRALGMSAAVAIVSALFAGVHVLQYYNNLGVIAVITLLSITLTLVRARSGSLLPSYVMHLVFNAIQAVILVLQPFVAKPAAENSGVSGFLIHALARLFT
jgi:membrane protease YdiL (CAAX protease family)